MKKHHIILAIAILASLTPLLASPGSVLVEERYKSALNRIVQEVRATEDPSAKREILGSYLDKMQAGLRQAEGMKSVAGPDRQVLHSMREKLAAYQAELGGFNGYALVADADLDAFAGYMQQGMEQAPIGGGVYLSGGAIIIILLILLLIT
jgi:hypothetical protein